MHTHTCYITKLLVMGCGLAYLLTDSTEFCSDWFRINPLEMVLLGCQTLANNDTAHRDVSHHEWIVYSTHIHIHTFTHTHAAPISTTTPTVHTQSEAAAQHSSSRVVDSVQIQAKSQEDSWPDIVPATTINLTDSEPDGQPDSSQQPSLKDLLLNLTRHLLNRSRVFKLLHSRMNSLISLLFQLHVQVLSVLILLPSAE